MQAPLGPRYIDWKCSCPSSRNYSRMFRSYRRAGACARSREQTGRTAQILVVCTPQEQPRGVRWNGSVGCGTCGFRISGSCCSDGVLCELHDQIASAPSASRRCLTRNGKSIEESRRFRACFGRATRELSKPLQHHRQARQEAIFRCTRAASIAHSMPRRT
jgi:hypothetical protein